MLPSLAALNVGADPNLKQDDPRTSTRKPPRPRRTPEDRKIFRDLFNESSSESEDYEQESEDIEPESNESDSETPQIQRRKENSAYTELIKREYRANPWNNRKVDPLNYYTQLGYERYIDACRVFDRELRRQQTPRNVKCVTNSWRSTDCGDMGWRMKKKLPTETYDLPPETYGTASPPTKQELVEWAAEEDWAYITESDINAQLLALDRLTRFRSILDPTVNVCQDVITVNFFIRDWQENLKVRTENTITHQDAGYATVLVKRLEWVYLCDDECNGVVFACYVSDQKKADEYELEFVGKPYLYVSLVCSNDGHGLFLMEQVDELAQKLKAHMIVLDALRYAIHFYLKSGYEFTTPEFGDVVFGNHLQKRIIDKTQPYLIPYSRLFAEVEAKVSLQFLVRSEEHTNEDWVKKLTYLNPAVVNESTDGKSPLYEAVEHSRKDLIDPLVDAQARIDDLNTDERNTALFKAVEMNNYEMVETLIRRGASTSIEGSKNTSSPLLKAAELENLQIATLLMNNGADPYKIPSRGTDSPLKYATDHKLTAMTNEMSDWTRP